MPDIKVHTHFSGSFCVVQLGDNWEHYIDVKRDVRHPEISFIDVVRAGRVRSYESVMNHCAPERIIELIKEQVHARSHTTKN